MKFRPWSYLLLAVLFTGIAFSQSKTTGTLSGTVTDPTRSVVPGADPANFLRVDEVVDVVSYLLHTGDNVKLGPEILLRTMRNPMEG